MDLWQLSKGKSAVIKSLSDQLHQDQVRRLLELGFEPGETIHCEQQMTLGGPRSFRTSSGVFCLEKNIAHSITVEKES